MAAWQYRVDSRGRMHTEKRSGALLKKLQLVTVGSVSVGVRFACSEYGASDSSSSSVDNV